MDRYITTFTLAVLLGSPFAAHSQANKACGLASPAEIEGVLGAKVTGLNPQGPGGASAQFCMGTSPKASVMLRLAKRKNAGPPGEAERKGIEIYRKMGAQVDVQTFGPITCSAVIPPKNLEAHGFNTTCTVSKGDAVAGIEITVKTRADMVPIEKLRPLAEKMSGRF
ncbi:MAG TPA: hypothetical protein VKL40_10575 [Candidatus Angelobacter sp.]|nr:hypothetical protein [Candidatus Angelobacter sp.]